MAGIAWWGTVLACGLIALVLGIDLHSTSGIIVGACATIVGAGELWHGGRFSPRRMRRP